MSQPRMSPAVFISYRREDGPVRYLAGRLADRLATALGDGQVFLDLHTIRPGDRFRDVINQSISQADVLVALIGPDWQDLLQQRGPWKNVPSLHDAYCVIGRANHVPPYWSDPELEPYLPLPPSLI